MDDDMLLLQHSHEGLSTTEHRARQPASQPCQPASLPACPPADVLVSLVSLVGNTGRPERRSGESVYCCDRDLEACSHTFIQLNEPGMPRSGRGAGHVTRDRRARLGFDMLGPAFLQE